MCKWMSTLVDYSMAVENRHELFVIIEWKISNIILLSKLIVKSCIGIGFQNRIKLFGSTHFPENLQLLFKLINWKVGSINQENNLLLNSLANGGGQELKIVVCEIFCAFKKSKTTKEQKFYDSWKMCDVRVVLNFITFSKNQFGGIHTIPNLLFISDVRSCVDTNLQKIKTVITLESIKNHFEPLFSLSQVSKMFNESIRQTLRFVVICLRADILHEPFWGE